jgi:MFS family permease
LGFFIYNFAFSGFTSIFVVFIRDRFDWEPAQAGSLLLVIGIVSIVVQGTLIGKIVPLFGEMTVSFTGLFLVSLALVLIALAPIGILLYGTQVIFALGVGLASPSLRGLLASSVAEQEQGKVSGASQSLVSLGQIIAPSIAGFSYDQLGMEVPFWGAALLVLLAIVTIWPNRGAMKSASH